MVGALLPRLPRAGAGEIAPEHEAAVQGWEQAAAMSGFGKTPGVRTTAEATSGLVRAVHIAQIRAGLSLAFEFGAGERRNIDLSVAAVRQMLSVMHDLHVATGWPTAFWPAWIHGPAERESQTALN